MREQQANEIPNNLMRREEKKNIDPNILHEIVEAVGRMKYGEIVITVDDTKVVQIEERKKKRFT